MKIIKTALHYWFVIVSVFSFILGWGILAHSLKPVAITQSTSSTSNISPLNLPAIQAFGSSNGGGLNFSTSSGSTFTNQTAVRPHLRSGGS